MPVLPLFWVTCALIYLLPLIYDLSRVFLGYVTEQHFFGLLSTPSFLGPLGLLGTRYLTEPLREASQATPLCGWAHGSQRY
jgi:hypothetical protein